MSAPELAWLGRHHDLPLASIEFSLADCSPAAAAREPELTRHWLAISARVRAEDARQRPGLRAWLLGWALARDEREALPVAIDHFAAVHAALAEQRLDGRFWEALRSHLPPISPWRAWDRCERLRRAVIALAARHGGSLAPLLKEADAGTVGFLVRSCMATRDGVVFLQRELGSRAPGA